MSEEKVVAAAEEHEPHHHHHHDEVEVERIETVSSTTTPWTVRLIFGILGLVFLGCAVAAWQFRDLFNGHIAEALPYIIIGLIVIGAGAIVESITTEIWLALIGGVIALAVTFLIVGRMQVIPNEGALYTVDRFTGAVQFCTPDGCLPLKQVSELPKPPAPPPPPPAESMATPAPDAAVPPPPPAKVAPAPAKVAPAPAKK
ncbi:hypothetical protein [Rhizomicrobium electricum]|uniref:Uncharacterized protein n=1 Tax=Rhizomicrobium electricum TaxID=480070 RepID=A0ABN1ERD0_9PROT|nr:hypothetical protein [Rhizomicrobium electricum]NIJ48929.1 hypothetical protein [Rhizomicrobium electricum]